MNRPSLTFVGAILAAALGPITVAFANADSKVRPGPVLQVTASDELGERLVITGAIADRDGRPVSDVELHGYQTDATGHYTPDKPMDEPHARLAGFLKSADGRFELRTIRPGGYTKMIRLGDRDRHIPPHIHIDITGPGHAERRLQVVFADDPLLLDPYWADWVFKLRQPVLSLERDGAMVRGRLVIALD